MPFKSVPTTARRAAVSPTISKPAKPNKCRKGTRKRLKRLKSPRAAEGFFLHPDAIERAWLRAKCDACGACALFA